MAGLANAPVTKFLCLATGGASLLLQTWLHKVPQSRTLGLVLDVLCFHNVGELFFGTMVLYYTRVFERRRGSHKHGSFLVATGSLASAAHMAATAVLLGSPQFPSLPYLAIFTGTASFITEIPPLSNFQVFGLMFSNKIFMCLVVLQLLYLAGSTRVFLTAICATVAGALYHGDVLGLRGFRVPMAAARICDRTLGRLLHSEPPLLAPQPHQQRATQGEAPQQGSGQGEPPPEALQQLQDMGFSLQQAQVALHLSGNDVQLALALLVSQQQ